MIFEAIEEQNRIIEMTKNKVGRKDDILLLAVSKNHPVEAINEAVKAGIKAVGENKVQEAKMKKELYDGPPIEWHLIGHLQRNKVKQALSLFDLIHSVDSERLLLEIDRMAEKEGKIQRILLQFNIARETTKSGASVEDYEGIVNLAKSLKNIRVEGLMCMAPFEEDKEKVRPVFRIAYHLYEEMKKFFPVGQIRYLSMGMSHDMEIAIEEGSTIVRVGTAIFGNRDYSV